MRLSRYFSTFQNLIDAFRSAITWDGIKKALGELELIFKQSAKKFGQDKCFLKAQALAYSTLLTFVPTMFVIFSMFPSAAIFEQVKDRVKELIFRVFLPSAAEKIAAYIDEFLRNATKLGVFGFVSFTVAAILFFETIDKAFGDLWSTRRRPPFIRLALFWSFLTIPVVLLALSFYFGLIFKMKFGIHAFPPLFPYLISGLAFSALYFVLPSTKIKPRYAILTGFFVAALWETARRGFGIYISRTISYKTIYGSLWVVPVFMFWLYLIWNIVLFGAEMVFVMQWPYGYGRLNLFKLLMFFKIMLERFETGKSPLTRIEAMKVLGIDKSEFEVLLDKMENKGWIVESEEAVGLGHSLKHLKAHDLLEMTNAFEEGDDEDVNKAIRMLRKALKENLDLTIYDLLRPSASK